MLDATEPVAAPSAAAGTAWQPAGAAASDAAAGGEPPAEPVVVTRGDPPAPVAQRAPVSGGTPVVMRDADPPPEVEAPAYIETFVTELGDGVRDFLAHQEFGLPVRGLVEGELMPSPFLTWKTPKSFGTAALTSVGADGGKALVARLPDLIRPSDLGELVNRGRKKGTVQVTDDKTTWSEERSNLGPATWYPDVAVEVGQALARRFIESLERITQRYLDARVATAVAEEAKTVQCLTDAPEPTDGVLTSAPIDVLTANALKAGLVKFDWPGYHLAYPTSVGNKQVARHVDFWVEPAQNGTYWVRVSSPADPLPEEVAVALFGDTAKTSRLAVVSPPLFGFGDASGLRPEAQARFADAGVDTTRTGDATAEGMKGPLADEIALAQSKVPAGSDKVGVLATLNESVTVLDSFATTGAVFGLGKDPTLGGVTTVRDRLVKKQTELATATEEAAAKWAGQVKDQRLILSQALDGFVSLVERFEGMTQKVKDATAKLGGFNLPPYVREAMHSAAAQYVDVVATSFFPATAQPKLRAADLANRLLPVTILEGTMAAIQRTVDDALAEKRKKDSDHASYDTEGMRKREVELRARLGAIKVRLIENPLSVGDELAELQAEIVDLQTEAEIVANMDQLDVAWQALDDSYSVWFSSYATTIKIRNLKMLGDIFHAEWKGIFNLWKKGDKASRDLAKSQLDTLRAKPALAWYFGKLRETVKSAQTEILIGKIVAMLVITVVTMGVGEFVAGWVGADLAAGAALSGRALLAVGGAEALTMTALSQLVLDTDHSAGHVAWEFATNFAMFSALRKFSAFAELRKLGLIGTASGQFVLLEAMGLAKDEIAKYARTGKHLTMEEIGQITVQSLVMFVALNGVGRLAQPILKGVRGSGIKFGTARAAANRAAGSVKAMNKALMGSKDLNKALEYIKAERAWVELKIKAYDQLEIDAKAEAEAARQSGKKVKGGLLEQAGMTSLEDVANMKAALGEHIARMDAAKTVLTLRPLGGRVFGTPRARIGEVLDQLGASKNPVTTDGWSTVRTYEAKSPDGKKITIIEELDQYDRWMVKVQKSLDGTELAKWEETTGRNTPKEVYDRYSGDTDLAVRTVKEDVREAAVGSWESEGGRTAHEGAGTAHEGAGTAHEGAGVGPAGGTFANVIASAGVDTNVTVGSRGGWRGSGDPPQWPNPKSTKAYGHVESTHGPRLKARHFQGRIASTGNDQGQWSGPHWVEAEGRTPQHPGRYIVEMGRAIGRVYRANAEIVEGVTRAFVQRNPDGSINSTYPVTNDFVL
ncbi:MAG TPA: hypothetical protein VKB57_11365 [Acidimicrobiales bacterium]|nr:hypothetical protein [Acidimicrobiales bacterium]